MSINNQYFYVPIELKSTKNNSIPGSSIQQIKPTEWVIFIKHNNNIIDITTGQYINAINTKMQFPDRSPRPQVSFNELSQWNKCKRILEKNTLMYKNDVNRSLKAALIEDWQNVLSERWVNMLFSSTTNASKEPWFNNNMRKFIIMFLEKYETLSSQEKDKFKNKIISLIK